jgi:hypothetical protein
MQSSGLLVASESLFLVISNENFLDLIFLLYLIYYIKPFNNLPKTSMIPVQVTGFGA